MMSDFFLKEDTFSTGPSRQYSTNFDLCGEPVTPVATSLCNPTG